MKKKILIVFGTRPEAIKMAPLIKEFQKNSNLFDVKICVTAQHREMLDQVLHIFDIKADYDLDLMRQGQDLFDITSRVLMGIKPVLEDFVPNLVLVHGDTTTGFATALASYYKQIPVAHIEAGLRTGDIYSPFPEEINRRLIGNIAKYHFAPTKNSVKNLITENIESRFVYSVGNTVIDALHIVKNRIVNNKMFEERMLKFIESKGYYISNRKIILVTGHRRENFGEGFLNICKALKKIAEDNQNLDIVYPVHLNPNVRIPVNKILKNIKNIYLIEPLEYEPFVYLMDRSHLILTDSGGIQEEAPSLGKPVLVMRETTERPEAVEAGTVKLVGTNVNKIILETEKLLKNTEEYNKMSKAHNPYGDGNTSSYILRILQENL